MSGSPKAVEICAKARIVNLSMCALMLTESCISVMMKKNQIIIDINEKNISLQRYKSQNKCENKSAFKRLGRLG